MPATRARLDADRWHWKHGPIDIVAQAEGEATAVTAAHEMAWQRFEQVLDELVSELPALRRPVGVDAARDEAIDPFRGPVARRMWQACRAFAPAFITPMAAVAGSVAEELIACYQRPGIARAWLNNGGDIALHLAPGASARVGLVADSARGALSTVDGELALDGAFEVSANMPVRGVATSGWRGRSLSMGIADSVTVLAASASQADAAATMVANAVDVQDADVKRRPANGCKDDSDLGALLVTVAVGALSRAQVQRALEAGERKALALQARGLLYAAVLVCQGQQRVIQPVCSPELADTVCARRALAVDAGSVFA